MQQYKISGFGLIWWSFSQITGCCPPCTDVMLCHFGSKTERKDMERVSNASATLIALYTQWWHHQDLWW